jgi:hypothetical protein
LRFIQYIKRKLHERRAKKQRETPADRAARRTANATVYIAILTVAIVGASIAQWNALRSTDEAIRTQAGIMKGQLEEMKTSSEQAERAVDASNRIAEATAQSVIVSNKLVVATTEAVAASKRLADETADAVAASKRLVAAAENSNVTSAKFAESAAKSNEISHQALLVAQRPFMVPISVDISKVFPSMLGLDILGGALSVPLTNQSPGIRM